MSCTEKKAVVEKEAKSQIVAKFIGEIFEKESGFCVYEYAAMIPAELPKELQNKGMGAKSCFKAAGRRLPKDKHKKTLLVGNWVTNTQTGEITFDVKSVALPQLSNPQDIKTYLMGYKCGVGEMTSTAILEAYGMDSLKAIKKRPNEVISLFKGAVRSGIKRLRDHIILDFYVEELANKLEQIGLGREPAPFLYARYGDHAIELVKMNPYAFVHIKAYSFGEVDKAAMANGLHPGSRMRVAGGAEYVINEHKHSGGNICIPEFQLIRSTVSLLNKSFTHCIDAKRVKSALSQEYDAGMLVASNGYVYLKEDYDNERGIAKKLAAMLSIPIEFDYAKKMEAALDRWQTRNETLTLHPLQKQAIMLLVHRVGIITGGPGTGKTTLLKAAMEIIHDISPDVNVSLMAPTGIAANRMRESVGEGEIPASTVHKALEIYPGRKIDADNLKRLPEGYLIVDETSMLDQKLAFYLMASIAEPDKYRLIFIGDVDQLPSVGPGDVLRQLINCDSIPCVRLQAVFRQDDGSIKKNSIIINTGDGDLVEDDFFEIIHTIEGAEFVRDLLIDTYMKKVQERGIHNCVILSPYRKHGMLSCNLLNPIIRELVNPATADKASIKVGNRLFRAGDKVVQMKTAGDISNGETGIVLSIEPVKKQLEIEFSSEKVLYSLENMRNVELGYVSTVHKSQGAEFSTLVMPMVEEHRNMLFNNLIYTAVSRAKESVHIIGDRELLHFAINNRPKKHRDTQLGNFIKQELAVYTGGSEIIPFIA